MFSEFSGRKAPTINVKVLQDPEPQNANKKE
jgi:hypothetical protein